MQARPTTIMTVDDFSKYIQNKRDLYEACERNCYYLPSKKSTMATEEFMRNVIKGSALCPRGPRSRCWAVLAHPTRVNC
jgi:hypothetical protein